jgi:hypothetical protein
MPPRDCTAAAWPLSFAFAAARGICFPELVMLFRVVVLVALVMSAVAANATEPTPVPTGKCGDQSKLPAAERVKNTARWTTASEEENFGYDVYRGNAEKGPFIKLTKQPLLGNGTTLETHKYEFADDTIDPCKDYWYYVESITTNGTREKFTPVFHVPAKRRAEAAAAPKQPVK